jgi:hypothetical protein
LFAAFVMVAGLLAATAAQAFPDAQVDAEIRPPFGALLHPRLRRFHPYYPERRFNRWGYERDGRYYPIGRDYNDYHGRWADGGWRSQHGYPQQGPIQTITVDCGDASLGPTPLSDALYALADGGTLYIRAGGHPCAETLVITRPVIIAGEPLSAFAPGPPAEPPVIAPPTGAPCLQVMPGAGVVELRDLVLSADQAGGQACIQSWDSDIALVRAHIHYQGDASAVYVSGGHLLSRDSDIVSGGYDPAVATEGAGLELDGVSITAAATGLDVGPGASPLTLDQVSITSAPGADPSLAPETGLTVRYERGGSATLLVRDSEISGFRTGVWLDQGARADISQVNILAARIGVVSRAVDLSVTNSELDVESTGIYLVMGHAKLTHSVISGFDGDPFAIERGADLFAEDNWIYPRHDCRGFRAFLHTCERYDERVDRHRPRAGRRDDREGARDDARGGPPDRKPARDDRGEPPHF